jgi:4-hydroxybenzoyl-CoA thioesterase
MDDRKFTHSVTVEWGDCDPADILFYPNAFRWFDQSQWRFFAAVGLTKEVLFGDYGTIGTPLIKTAAEYRIPCPFGTRLDILTEVTRWGRTSFDVRHRIYGPEGDLRIVGREVRVWAAKPEGGGPGVRPVPVPQKVKDLLPAVDDPAD